MRIRLSIDLRVSREQPPPPSPEVGPAGAESMVVHQEQPRFIGFQPNDTETVVDLHRRSATM